MCHVLNEEVMSCCFSFLKLPHEQHQHHHQGDEEAELVLKSFELMKSSQQISVFPGLRWIHAPESMQHRRNAQDVSSDKRSNNRRSNARSRRWEPLHVLIEKGVFKGKPMPLPSPPPEEDDENLLVPPLVRRTHAELSSVPSSPPEVWGIKLKCFRFEELASACQEFSSRCCIREGGFGKVYKCLMHVRNTKNIGKRKMEVAVFRLHDTPQDLESWISKVKWMATLHNPNVCRLIGFSASNRLKDKRVERLLVFEHCDYGGLDVLLSKSQYIRPLSWSTRVDIAIGAAKGLAYLHDKSYFQVMYTDFNAANILIDKDFNAKLSDYCLCCSSKVLEPKKPEEWTTNDVGSFGLVLLELLVGSKNMKRLVERKEQSSRWILKLLRDESKLNVIVDAELRSEARRKPMRRLADVALKCLRKESSLRPSMREVVEQLEPLRLVMPGADAHEQAARARNLLMNEDEYQQTRLSR